MFVFLDPSVCICFTLPSARVALPSARVVLPSACVVSLCHQLEDSAIRSCCSSISPCSNSKSTAAANIRNRIRFVYSLCHLARFPQAIVFFFELPVDELFFSFKHCRQNSVESLCISLGREILAEVLPSSTRSMAEPINFPHPASHE